MAELTIRPEEIRSALNEFAESYKPAEVAAEEVGHVVFAADGIAHVEGLPGVMANELLTFEDGTAGLAMNLEERRIGVVVLGSFDGIDEGQVVRRTGEVLSVPVGDAYLGRVVDPLGRPIDGLGEIEAEGRRDLIEPARLDLTAPRRLRFCPQRVRVLQAINVGLDGLAHVERRRTTGPTQQFIQSAHEILR